MKSPALSTRHRKPFAAVKETIVCMERLVAVLVRNILQLIAVALNDACESCISLDCKGRNFVCNRVKIRIVKRHSWWIMSLEINLVVFKVRLFSLGGECELRSCSMVRIRLPKIALFSETWNIVVSRACHIMIHGHLFRWSGTAWLIECIIPHRHRERRASDILSRVASQGAKWWLSLWGSRHYGCSLVPHIVYRSLEQLVLSPIMRTHTDILSALSLLSEEVGLPFRWYGMDRIKIWKRCGVLSSS